MVFEQEGHVTRVKGGMTVLMAHSKRVTRVWQWQCWGPPTSRVLGKSWAHSAGHGEAGSSPALGAEAGCQDADSCPPSPRSFWLAKPHCHLVSFNSPSSPRGSFWGKLFPFYRQEASTTGQKPQPPTWGGSPWLLPGAGRRLREAGKGAHAIRGCGRSGWPLKAAFLTQSPTAGPDPVHPGEETSKFPELKSRLYGLLGMTLGDLT